ncbi:MAG: GH3 auxin-responsive promoter family protein [Prevotellaceae bacterium]|nr:GH3 auxin-responsive promoter family protein [Prevotellaceae bacterium]
MSLTRIIRPFFSRRYAQICRYDRHAEEIQRGVLRRLVRAGAATAFGQRFGFGKIETYERFSVTVPLSDYEALKADIDRMRHGSGDLLWPGRTRWFAQSSGTTSDRSKFIPVTQQSLADTHYRGGADAVTLYLHHHPESRLFDGRALILGGSHAPNFNLPHSLVGDLSAILIENINPLVNLVRTPSKNTALLADFEQKRDRIAREALTKNVTSLSGVPSWMMSVLQRVLELSGKSTISEVWPRLEVFFHGGVSFTPYRQQYRSLLPHEGMHYMETYNASEGFFGLQDDPAEASLLLMLDYGVFYEFIPLDELGNSDPTVLPVWEVEAGRNYAMVITTSSGLWRYLIGDTVRFTSVQPYKFVITGRTKSFINAFGEELIVDNAERGLAEACRATGASVKEYTAAPVFMNARGECRHQWVVEFDRRPADTEAFAEALDKALQRLNSDYEAKRYKNLTLQRLELVTARSGLFDDWLRSRGKLGGQHKVPRLANTRDIIEQILALNA